MKHIILFFVVISFSLNSTGQSLKEIDAIPLNSKFTLILTPNDSDKYDYKIVKIESYNESLSMSSIFSKFDQNLEKNMVQGFFGKGKFGSNESILLAIKNGADEMLQYDLYIDTKGKKKFEKTTTAALHSNLPSIEMWPYLIHSIKILTFTKAE